VIGVDFGYTPIPMAEMAPDRLIGHFDGLRRAVMELVPSIGDMPRENTTAPDVKAD
jgi:hypothetical protein